MSYLGFPSRYGPEKLNLFAQSSFETNFSLLCKSRLCKTMTFIFIAPVHRSNKI